MAALHDLERSEREERAALARRLEALEELDQVDDDEPPPAPAAETPAAPRRSWFGPVLAAVAVLGVAVMALIAAKRRREVV
jgi:hypothetical protein